MTIAEYRVRCRIYTCLSSFEVYAWWLRFFRDASHDFIHVRLRSKGITRVLLGTWFSIFVYFDDCMGQCGRRLCGKVELEELLLIIIVSAVVKRDIERERERESEVEERFSCRLFWLHTWCNCVDSCFVGQVWSVLLFGLPFGCELRMPMLRGWSYVVWHPSLPLGESERSLNSRLGVLCLCVSSVVGSRKSKCPGLFVSSGCWRRHRIVLSCQATYCFPWGIQRGFFGSQALTTLDCLFGTTLLILQCQPWSALVGYLWGMGSLKYPACFAWWYCRIFIVAGLKYSSTVRILRK